MEHDTLKSICELAYSPLLITPESLTAQRVDMNESVGMITPLTQSDPTEADLSRV